VPTVSVVIGEGGSGGGDRDRRRRPRADAGERDLLGHLALRDAPRSCGATRRRRRRPRPRQA
jgi:hypothetical protein